jgi:hypothetical protein
MTPYFYLIRNKTTGKLYAGCKYGKDADPSNFLTPKGYHTSSSTIKKQIEESGPEAFEILILKTEEECKMHVHTFESRWLKDHDCVRRKEYYNMNGPWHPSPYSPEFKCLMLKKYGVQNPIQSPYIREKTKKTVLAKYGDSNIMSTEHFKTKSVATFRNNYGVDNPSQAEIVKEKKRLTNQKNRGSDTNMGTELFKQQVKETFVLNYGVDNPSKSRLVKEKKRQTSLKNFGVDHHTKTPEGKAKASEWGKNARANDQYFSCPHCNKTGKGGAMLRWHFDNCKFLVR